MLRCHTACCAVTPRRGRYLVRKGRKRFKRRVPLVRAPLQTSNRLSVLAAFFRELARDTLSPVDRANAIRLLKALVAAGANSDTLMAGAWVDGVALKASLRGTDLASALAYAEGQGWIADGVKKGWMTITRSGERAARLYVVGL
jgi:hypothetical protein